MNRSVILLALCLAAGACVPTMRIPPALDPGANASLALVAQASGAQVYECRVRKGEVDAYEWSFIAPDAQLTDDGGHVIGHHGAGPSWEASDGSRVMGKVVARADSPAGAIPWLLLAAENDGPDGRLSRVTSIQRVNTVGGTTPSVPCTRAVLGRQLRMHYTADYRFFVKHSPL
jgi:hypothetical protein